MRLKIASRSSDLARWQAVRVGETIANKFPHISIEYIFKSSFGDQNLDLPLAEMESKGVFTQDFYQDLVQSKFDLVVHSWKDLPTEEREDTEVVATLERADVRDILLVPKEVWTRAQETNQLKILTSSPRRIYNLSPWLPKLLPAYSGEMEFINVRGNIPSRLDKMFSQDAGLIMAKAALDRMLSGGKEFEDVKSETKKKISKCHFMILPLEINPAAAGQGALAIEISKTRADLKEILKVINDQPSFQNVEMKRAILKSYGGGCHQKIGVTRVVKQFGIYHVEKGESDWGTKLERCELLKSQVPLSLKGHTKESVFPLSLKDNSWFERKNLEVKEVDLSRKAVLVARHIDGLRTLQSAGQIWAAGLTTWEKLARDGHWVNGCFEGLGEQEKSWVGPLAESLSWVKISHDESPEGLTESLLPLYHLEKKSKEHSPNLTGKKYFFWMSASSFQRAVELYPEEVQQGFHGCGPGLTYEILKGHPALKEPPEVFLNLEEFHPFFVKN